MTVLVTGASGFIGRNVVTALLQDSFKVRVACRQGTESPFRSYNNVEIRYLSGSGCAAVDWVDAVGGCNAVIHAAARAHSSGDPSEDSLRAFRLANVDFARSCGEAAASAGVQRFIFISSVGVHGSKSDLQPIEARSAFKPHTQYAASKAEAERAIASVALRSSMQLTVVRPPLVYGPGAPGNFGLLVRAVARGLPLPFASLTRNRRSFVAVGNLVDLILTCLTHPGAANQEFVVSDGHDLSTAELIRRVGVAMGKPARLFPVPMKFLDLATRVMGKRELLESLCGSLQVDIKRTRDILGWQPSLSVDEGLRIAVDKKS